ncbi:MAG: hypothetical protein AB1757_21385 [Acidobacteriota bacterium]
MNDLVIIEGIALAIFGLLFLLLAGWIDRRAARKRQRDINARFYRYRKY